MTIRRIFSKAYKTYKQGFDDAFNRKNLFYTNILLSVTISTCGDLIEQKYEIHKGVIDRIDWPRTAHMGFSGFTTGIICHHWYNILDKIIIGRTLDMVVKKLLLDQFICSPIIILSFFGTVAIFEEHPLENFTEEVRDKFWTLYKAEWVVWPPAQIINFYFLPTSISKTKMQALGITWRKLATNVRCSSTVTGLKKAVKVAFSDKYLLYTNISLSISLSALGDIIEQRYEIYIGEQDKLDTKRTMHMAFSGASVGVLCHYWYKILDRFIIGRTLDMVAKKLMLDQFIFSPIMIVTFFGSVALFEDDPYENFKEEVRDKFVTLYRAEWMVWPPAQIVNFYFLPTKYRVLYDNTISLGYDIYTSQVKHKKGLKSSLEKSKESKGS